MRIAFWNTCKKTDSKLINSMFKDVGVQLLFICEAGKDCLSLNNELQVFDKSYFISDTEKRGILAIGRHSTEYRLELLRNAEYWSCWNLVVDKINNFTIYCVHLPSQRYRSADHRLCEVSRLADEITSMEQLRRHSATIILGDFNMSPYDPAMVSAGGLHATMDSNIAHKVKRKVSGIDRPYFFNPMWTVQNGHCTEGVYGSYHYPSSDSLSYFWHTFDQILLRPRVIETVPLKSIQLLTRIGGHSLLQIKKSIPNKDISDHLPIIFEIEV